MLTTEDEMLVSSPQNFRGFGDIHVHSDLGLNQSLPELITRFQDSFHEEVLPIFGDYVIFASEELPEYLKRRNLNSGIIVQLYRSKGREVKPELGTCDSFERQSTSTPLKVSASSDDLDLTGSPLKCPFVVSKDDAGLSPVSFKHSASGKKIRRSIATFQGMPINLARNIASNLLSALKKTSTQGINVPPIWIACNSRDSQRTVFLGIDLESCMTLMNVTCSGPHLGSDNLPTIDRLTTHFCFACPTRRVELSVEALYDVFSNGDDQGSTVHISSSWQRPLSTLSAPTLDASTTAQIHIDLCDVRSDAHHIYIELATLEGFINGLETCEVNWFMRNEELSVTMLLQQYFKSIVEKAEKHRNDDCAANFDKIIEAKFFEVRNNMEFTDKLWSILLKSGSNSELQNGLNYIFEAITIGTIRPQVQVKNKTMVAETSRNLMRGITQDLNLTGSTPLEMLIQIGLEKIKRDYISIFQVCELATGEQLQPFINWNITQDPYKNCLSKLRQMHTALQVVVVLRKYLKLPAPILALCTTQVLAELAKTEDKADFDFPLQTSLIANLFISLHPAMWKLKMSCQTDYFYKSMDFYIKRDAGFFSSGIDSDSKDFDLLLEGKENEDSTHFYCLAVTSTTDEFLT